MPRTVQTNVRRACVDQAEVRLRVEGSQHADKVQGTAELRNKIKLLSRACGVWLWLMSCDCGSWAQENGMTLVLRYAWKLLQWP
jgi:hypothetical protein